MTAEQFSQMINNRQYGNELTFAELELAKSSGLLICYGYSDDLLMFEGILNDECGAYNGTKVFLTINKYSKLKIIEDELLEQIDELNMEHELNLSIPMVAIDAKYDENGIPWTITTDIPHTKFNIMDEGNIFCQGIVIEQKDIMNHLTKQLNQCRKQNETPL